MANKPSLVVDDYIERLGFAISLSLGIYETQNIMNQIHFLKYMCIAFAVLAVTFYVQWYIGRVAKHYNELFVLFWRIASKVVNFVQYFLTTITSNIIVQKIQENASRQVPVDLFSKFMIYITVFTFLTSITVLLGWYFYEQKVHHPLPENMIHELTKNK